jgi:hypothetical protein
MRAGAGEKQQKGKSQKFLEHKIQTSLAAG